MRVVILNKSDSTGGAAVVSRRLMEALRREGIDARMIVCEKLTDSPFIETAASKKEIKFKFLLERLRIFMANGFNRATLFKIDTGEEGLPLWRHPLVKSADAVLINWVNQGMLSLKGFEKILKLGKPVVWTMHDMWEMTGICHHAGLCDHFHKDCGECPLLGKRKGRDDLSKRIWEIKNYIYSNPSLIKKTAFVAVSRWLKEKSMMSSLLKDQRVEVIPNAFDTLPLLKNETGCRNIENTDGGEISQDSQAQGRREKENLRILFGAARLDDPIKGLDTLKEALEIIKDEYPETIKNLEIAFFGSVKNEEALKGFPLPVIYLGVLKDEQSVRKAYEASDILISASSYETLPGTLVEAQAYGCIPVSFNQGGQSDIVVHKDTGYIASYDESPRKRAENLARGILWAAEQCKDKACKEKLKEKMIENVKKKFSYEEVARKYIDLIGKLQ